MSDEFPRHHTPLTVWSEAVYDGVFAKQRGCITSVNLPFFDRERSDKDNTLDKEAKLYKYSEKNQFCRLPQLSLTKQKDTPKLLEKLLCTDTGVFDAGKPESQEKTKAVLESISTFGYCSFSLHSQTNKKSGKKSQLIALGAPTGEVVFWRPFVRVEGNTRIWDWASMPQPMRLIIQDPEIVKIQMDIKTHFENWGNNARHVVTYVEVLHLLRYVRVGRKKLPTVERVIENYLRSELAPPPSEDFSFAKIDDWENDADAHEAMEYITQIARSPIVALYYLTEDLVEEQDHPILNHMGYMRYLLFSHVNLDLDISKFIPSENPNLGEHFWKPGQPHCIRDTNLMLDANRYYVRLDDFEVTPSGCDFHLKDECGGPDEPEAHAEKIWNQDASRYHYLKIEPGMQKWCSYCGQKFGWEKAMELHAKCKEEAQWCIYELCNRSTEHHIVMCPVLHNVCTACGRRGHHPEHHKSHGPHHLDYMGYVFAHLGKMTSAVFLENTARAYEVRNSHWLSLPMHLSRNQSQKAAAILRIKYKEPIALRGPAQIIISNSRFSTSERLALVERFKTKPPTMADCPKRPEDMGREAFERERRKDPKLRAHDERVLRRDRMLGRAPLPDGSYVRGRGTRGSRPPRGYFRPRGDSRDERGYRGRRMSRGRGRGRGRGNPFRWTGDHQGEYVTNPNNITINAGDEDEEKETLETLRKATRKPSVEDVQAIETPPVDGAQILELTKTLAAKRVERLKRMAPENPQNEQEKKFAVKATREAKKEEDFFGVLIPYIEQGCGPSQPKKSRLEILRENRSATQSVIIKLVESYIQMGEEIKKESEIEKQRAAEALVAERERLRKEIGERERQAAERQAKEEEEQKKLREQLAASEAAAQQVQTQENMDTSHATSYVDSPLAELGPRLQAILRPVGQTSGARDMSTPLMSPIIPFGPANLFGISRIVDPSIPAINEENEPMDTHDVSRENQDAPLENQEQQNVGQSESDTSQRGATNSPTRDIQNDPTVELNQTLDGSIIDSRQIAQDIARNAVEQSIAKVLGSGSSAPKSYAFVAKSPLPTTRTEVPRVPSTPPPSTSRARSPGSLLAQGRVLRPRVLAPRQLPIQPVRPMTPMPTSEMPAHSTATPEDPVPDRETTQEMLEPNDEDLPLEEATGAEYEARFGPMLDE